MLLRPEDQFHVGIVVDDLAAARRWFTDTMGYEWGAPMELEYTMVLPSGPLTYHQHLNYSVTEPRLELVQSVEGTPLQPSSSGIHHFGYWCDDVEATSAALVADGWTWECGGHARRAASGMGVPLQPVGRAGRAGERGDAGDGHGRALGARRLT